LHTEFWSEDLQDTDHSVKLGIDGAMLLEWILGKGGEKEWSGFIWFRIGTNGWLL